MNVIPAVILAMASAHVPPDPPQHAMPAMSNEQMIELMQMEDDATFGLLLFDELEWTERESRDAVHWDAEAWLGNDYDKAWLRTEGNWIEGAAQGLADSLREPAQEAAAAVKDRAAEAGSTLRDEGRSAADDLRTDATDAADTVKGAHAADDTTQRGY